MNGFVYFLLYLNFIAILFDLMDFVNFFQVLIEIVYPSFLFDSV